MTKIKYRTEYKLDYQIFENKNIDSTTIPQIWFAFHGIGQNTDAFKNFAIQKNFKIYSFGLFYHEKNQIELENTLKTTRETTLENWLLLMSLFLEKEKLNFQEKSINIIGFSLGVRPALQFVSNFSKIISKFSPKNNSISINEIILLAPETLAISNWYRFGTQTSLGKFLLKKTVSSTYIKEIILFFSSFIFSHNAQKLIRYQIYNGINSLASAWLSYRSFEIKGKEWREIYENYEDRITIVASEIDNFVNLKKIEDFVKKNSTDKGKSIKWIFSTSTHARLLKEFRL